MVRILFAFIFLVLAESLIWASYSEGVTFLALGFGGVLVLIMLMLRRPMPGRFVSGGVLSFSGSESHGRFVPSPSAEPTFTSRPPESSGRSDRCPGEDKILRLARTLPAPSSVVFKALTSPELLLQWWAAGDDCETCLAEIDLRPEGVWRLGMRFPGRRTPHICHGVYRQLGPHRLIFTWTWESPPIHAGTTVVSIELTDLGSQTRLDLAHRYFWNEKHMSGHRRGWDGCLDHLERFLMKRQPSVAAA